MGGVGAVSIMVVCTDLHGSFRKLGVPYFGVLIIRVPQLRELY